MRYLPKGPRKPIFTMKNRVRFEEEEKSPGALMKG